MTDRVGGWDVAVQNLRIPTWKENVPKIDTIIKIFLSTGSFIGAFAPNMHVGIQYIAKAYPFSNSFWTYRFKTAFSKNLHFISRVSS